MKCPACNTELKTPRCSKSRYDDTLWICSECGVKEAFEGFFWRNKHAYPIFTNE